VAGLLLKLSTNFSAYSVANSKCSLRLWLYPWVFIDAACQKWNKSIHKDVWRSLVLSIKMSKCPKNSGHCGSNDCDLLGGSWWLSEWAMKTKAVLHHIVSV
jgi:hypothetical protein